MSNSKLVNHTNLSPNFSSRNGTKIDTITIHHMAGNLSVETCGRMFADPSAEASSNYGIGTDGRVGLYVDEANRSWCSSNGDNDRRAVTIEVANDQIGGDWHVSDTAMAKLIDLCVDICRRNGIAKLNYTGDTSGNLTMHCWFKATACPGPYLKSKFGYIADEVNKRLDHLPKDEYYRVQIGAFSNKQNAYTYAETAESKGLNVYIKHEGSFYKVQIGAYKNRENAIKALQKAKVLGFSKAYIVEPGQGTGTTPAAKTIKVGDRVTVIRPVNYDNGERIWLYFPYYTVMELKGDRAVIGVNGIVTSAISVNDIKLA